MSAQPIAIFDSGLGGLSVVRRLRQTLPHESLVYFGDTARVPYGTKSARTVAQFSLETARFLLAFDPKLIICACNTASALALPELQAALPLPVVGVVEPGARAAAQRARGRPIGVLGTEATVASAAYPGAIRALCPDAEVLAVACPLFVPLVEEGRATGDPLVRLAVETYLTELRDQRPGVVVLGCTHYPLLRAAISDFLGPEVDVVDSGEETAAVVRALLTERGSLCAAARAGSLRCYASDNPERFGRIGSRFLSEPIDFVEFVEPERYVSLPHLDARA